MNVNLKVEWSSAKPRSQRLKRECRLEEYGSCHADIFLMAEVLANATYSDLFPINALRNVALLAARTELIVIGDGELFD